MVNALSDVEGSILDCKKAIEEFDNELLQLHWDIFDRVQDQFKGLDSELSNLRGLFDDFKATDGSHNWSNEGLAQLGLLAQQYELAKYRVQQYNEAIEDLNGMYADGKYSATEYVDKLAELSSAQWEAVNSSEDIKDAIIDLNETRINEEIGAIEKEIDAYKELIDAQIKALRASKDLHDYQQSIAEKTKAVTDLERQIAAMQNDDTASTAAKRKKLEEQLAQAGKDLEDAEYEHSIEAQENALNKEFEDYEAAKNAEIEALRASLEEREGLIAQSFEAVKANADTIGQEIAYTATQHGVTVSEAVITSWQRGEDAVASYGEALSAGTSAFIGNIIGVENEVYALQYKANETADGLAYMFATRADNLVNELANAYYSEENLGYMTQSLHDSLINTLEGGYNISGITSALDSIAGGLGNVASAANNAAQALAGMGAAQANAASQASKAVQAGINVNNAFLNAMDNAGSTKRPVASHSMIGGSGNRASAETVMLKNIPKYAQGGAVKKDKDNPLNEAAEAMGEDTMVAVKEGEVILTPEEAEMAEKRAKLQEFFIAMGGYVREDGMCVLPADQGIDQRKRAKYYERTAPEGNIGEVDLGRVRSLNASANMPEAICSNTNNTPVHVNMDKMVHIDHVDSTNMKQVEGMISKAQDKFVEKLYNGIKYRRT